MTPTLVPISEATGRLSELVRGSGSEDVLLLRHVRPAAVLISTDRYEALLVRMEDMADRLSIYEREGVTMDYEKMRAELGLAAD